MTSRWEPWSGPRGVRPDPNMRVSDAERTEVAETLSEHYADGRLDQAEFKERLDRAMAAKTRADLAGLMTDLPPLASSTPPPTPRRRGSRALVWVLVALAVAAWSLPWNAYHWPFVPHIPLVLVAVAVFFVVRRSSFRHHRAQMTSGPRT